MVNEISRLVYKKLVEIENIVDSDWGEWENNEEERICNIVGNICCELKSILLLEKEVK